MDTVASAQDTPYLQALGAQKVYDYKTQHLNMLPHTHYDMVLDGMGGSMFLQSLQLIKAGGAIASLKVMTSLDDMVRMGMRPPAILKWLLPLVFRKYTQAAKKAGIHVAGIATYADGPTLNTLGQRAATLDYQPRIAKTFALQDVHEAFTFFVTGKPKGKVVVVV